MNFFILGLDGLEYNLVRKWNLDNLKQKQFGKLIVPVNETLKVPTTPEVWGAFLTGKNIRVQFKKTEPTPFGLVIKVLKILRKITNLSFGLAWKIRRTVPEELHTIGTLTFPPLKHNTFLDLTDSIEINVPYYGFKSTEILEEFASGKLSLSAAIQTLRSAYTKRKEDIAKATEEDTDVVFAYMHFPDLLQHFHGNRPSRIREVYFDLDFFVSELRDRISPSTMLLIVSDHGFDFQTESHSFHGFYSCNKVLHPEPKLITDFFQIITGQHKEMAE